MKLSRSWLGLLLALALWMPRSQASEAPAPVSKAALPGVEFAQAVSVITGVAISPLMGMGAVGAWRYYQAAKPDRERLPWFAQPWFWAPALLLVALVFLKDLVGPVVPTTLKKPLDVAETIENKISGLVAAGAFVPLLITLFGSLGHGQDSAGLAGAGFAAINWADWGNVVLMPFAIIAFAIVWLAGHSINVLILISPFATVDLALKTVRTLLASTVVFASFANPYVGAAWAAVIILFCWTIAGWSFRVAIFGTVFIWDLLTRRHRRFNPNSATIHVFTARKIGPLPVRTLGRLRRGDDGSLLFEYRPWLVRARVSVALPAGDYVLGRGFFSPEMLYSTADDTTSLLRFPPRYRNHEEAVAQALGIGEVRDVGMLAAWRWAKELFGFGGRASGSTA